MRPKIVSSSRTSGVGRRVVEEFVAAAVFSVSYFLNVVEEFRSCLSKPEGFLGFTIKVAIVHVAV